MPLRIRSHRLYLYLLHPGGAPGEFEWLASSNGFLPSLWQILLADAQPRPELRGVLLSDSDTWVAVDANVALARFRAFRELVLRHPSIHRVAGLSRYLEAAERYFEQSIQRWRKDDPASPVMCVNLALLPALDPAHGTPRDYPAELREFREQLDRMLHDRDALAIDAVMGFPQRNLGFEDWKAWSGMFGLAQLEPQYFSGAFRRPFEGDYADHEYDELGSEPDLGNGLQRFKSGTRWGVRSEQGEVFAAEWDRILRTGEPALAWIERDSRYGLASMTEGRILRQPDLDEVHAFVAGKARVRVGNAVGLLNLDGSWLLTPTLQEIHAFAYGLAVIRTQDNSYGYIDRSGAVAIEPVFDEADDFTATGVARVRKGERCGLIRQDGSFALPLQFTSLEYSSDFGGWKGERDGNWLLMHADGSAWIDTGWDAIEVFVPAQRIRVRRGSLFGLQRWDGSQVLACEFEELLPLEPSLNAIARRDGSVGLTGPDGEQRIPFEYASIEATEPQTEGDARLSTPNLLRVMSPPGKAAPRFGIWDLERQRCVVPCAYGYLWTALLGTGNAYGFIAGNRTPKRGGGAMGRYRVGILSADGAVLIPQDYAWIAESTPLNRPDAMIDIRNTLYHDWSRGDPVRAAVNENGPMVGLSRPEESPQHAKRSDSR